LFRSKRAPADRYGLDPFSLFCRSFAYFWALLIIYPILYMISLSLRQGDELSTAAFGLIPQHLRLQNYPDAFNLFAQYVVPIPQLALNSALVSGGAIVGTLLCAIPASYAFATMSFKGKRIAFYILLLGLIVPIAVMLIPEFITVRQYNLIGTRWSLIFPYIAFGLPLPTLILTSFFQEVPTELFEAAAIDGASRFRMLVSIILPIARPAIATSAVFLGLMFWNEFPLALVIIQNPDLTTVPLGLASVQGKGGSPWQLIAAAILVTSLPVVVLFSVLQRQFIEGLVHGSVKG
jgi:raffinose/stachyose/melibiose transport system permease protein